MILNTSPADPHWIDLPHGVRVKVRPLTTALLVGAEQAALRTVDRIAELRAELLAMGAPPVAEDGATLPDVSDGNMRAGLVVAGMIRTLARHAILEWSGVTDASGTPLPWRPDLAEPFANDPNLGPAFLREYERPLRQRAAEGNGFAPSLSGSTAGAPNTAPDASPTPPPAAPNVPAT